jgi:hypothetical protein
MNLQVTLQHDPGGPFEMESGFVTFAPRGGAPIRVGDLSDNNSHFVLVADVPADVTGGTIVIGGSMNERYNYSLGTFQMSVAQPVSIPTTIPVS